MTSRRAQILLQPDVLLWARVRAGISRDELARKMKVKVEQVIDWEEDGNLSIAQADKLAERTHTPLGFLYLSKPPEDVLPIPDFRTRHAHASPRRPTLDLLETVHAMQRRQAWMREELLAGGAEPLPFVGACSFQHSHIEVAAAIRDALGISTRWAEDLPSWSDALRFLRDRLDTAGVLIVFNGVVGNSTRRKLDRDEFQGFVLVDDYAPLIFVNNTDYIAAKTFTLAHELAHICIRESGVSGFDRLRPSPNATERFCDQAAAEFLVPESSLRQMWHRVAQTHDPYQSVARHFKVSVIVAARRLRDLELIDRDTFFDVYDTHKQQGSDVQSIDDGGNFWNTQKWRIGPRFAAAVVRATKEGRLAYREAYSLTGLGGKSFDNLAGKLDIPL